MQPFIKDVVSFTLVDSNGDIRECSRHNNAPLFKRVIGGYGLFGVVVHITLQLSKREKVERVVLTLNIDELPQKFKQRREQGYLYGDFQFAIDPDSTAFLQQGIFSCYRVIDSSLPINKGQLRLTKQNWEQLLYLAHTNKTKAFEQFKLFYLKSSGQRYWSDTHQLSIYLDDYHERLDQQMGCECKGSEMITELYMSESRLIDFMHDARTLLRRLNANIIYGTVRLIRKDDESALPWAREDFACVIFNLHTDHNDAGLEKSRKILCALIDLAIAHQGSYFPTYHRFASKQQVIACFPEFVAFLQHKLDFDPNEIFQSNWYRHYRKMFTKEIQGVSLNNISDSLMSM